MRTGRRLSIKNRLILIHWLVTLAVLLLLGTAVFWGYSAFQRKDVDDFLQDEARGISGAVISFVEGHSRGLPIPSELNSPEFRKFIAGYLAQRVNLPLPYKVTLALMDSQGNFWGVSNKAVPLDYPTQSPPKFVDPQVIDPETTIVSFLGEPVSFRMISAPILLEGFRLGQLRLAVITTGLQADQRSFLAGLIAFLVALSLLESLLILSLTTRTLRPVQDMSVSAEKITESSLQLRIPEPPGRDEIGTLARTFNHLLSRLQKSYEFQDQVVGELSHQLKTPLTILRGRNEAALAVPHLTPEVRTVLEDNLMDLDRMASLITTLLNIARLETHSADLQKVPLDLEKLINEVKDELEPLWLEKGLTFQWSSTFMVETIPPNGVWGDRFFIKQALMNLMVNSYKFSPANGVIQVDLSPAKGSGGQGERGESQTVEELYISLRISNEGPPIPEADLEKIFQRFYQSNSGENGSAGEPGTLDRGFGLGLSISKRIIEQHGGTIRAFNPASGGAAFEILLPYRVEKKHGGRL